MSNANGNYVKFADGTQICTGSVTISFNSSDSYVAGRAEFPVAFISIPVAVSGTYNGVSNGSASDAAHPSTTACTICVSPTRGRTFGTPATFDYLYIVIGRWR